MFDILNGIEKRYTELEKLLSDPEIIRDSEKLQKYTKEYGEKKRIVELYRKYRKIEEGISQAEVLLDESNEHDIRKLAEEELETLREERDRVERDLRLAIVSRQPGDEKNIIMEIRAGTGGKEAALFAEALFRMYTRYAESKNWRSEILNMHPTELGGFKEVIFSIEGKDVYGRMKFESGVHRVQRVPATESSGRIHTSACTVAVLQEAEEIEVNINRDDLRIDTFSSSSAGGQHLNRTYSAVRITHIPTGMVTQCQDERSQIKNKSKAMKILRARLLEKTQREKAQKEAKVRKLQVGSGDRSEKVRTYNFPQNRITDHRINLTLYNLESIINGNLDPVVDELMKVNQENLLRNGGSYEAA